MALPQPDRMSGVAPANVRYTREQTLLYQLVKQYWPEFQTQWSETSRFLPRHSSLLWFMQWQRLLGALCYGSALIEC